MSQAWYFSRLNSSYPHISSNIVSCSPAKSTCTYMDSEPWERDVPALLWYLPRKPGGSTDTMPGWASKINLEFPIHFQTEGLGKSQIIKFCETQNSFREGQEDAFGVAWSLAARGKVFSELVHNFSTRTPPLVFPLMVPITIWRGFFSVWPKG